LASFNLLAATLYVSLGVGCGKDCTITATVLTNGLVQLNLVFEFKGEVIDGVKIPSHSERSQSVFRPGTVPADWRVCFFQRDSTWRWQFDRSSYHEV